MSRILVTTLVVVLLALRLQAQARVGLASSSENGRLSPATVVTLAVLDTAVPLAIGGTLIAREELVVLGGILVAWGWAVGPSPFSLMYGNQKAALVGVSIRSACMLAALAATAGGTWDEDGSNGTEIAILGFMAVSALTTVLEIIGLPAAVRDHNAPQLSIAPTLMRDGPGMRLRLRL